MKSATVVIKWNQGISDKITRVTVILLHWRSGPWPELGFSGNPFNILSSPFWSKSAIHKIWILWLLPMVEATCPLKCRQNLSEFHDGCLMKCLGVDLKLLFLFSMCSRKKSKEQCKISDECWDFMTSPGYSAYSLSHQVFYLEIGTQVLHCFYTRTITLIAYKRDHLAKCTI